MRLSSFMAIPNYTLRSSKKAKYLQLRISHQGLLVVVPEKHAFTSAIIEAFIQKKLGWIHKHWKCQENDKVILPSQIHLNAMNQLWQIKYVPTQGNKLKLITNPSHQIILMGNIKDIPSCFQLLKKWLKNVAQQFLVEELYKASKDTGLLFKDVSVRHNVTRWGSCSTHQHISLCCKLLLLSYPLMRHVLLHELCHTKVMNHGPTFWKLLETFDRDAKVNAKQLRIMARELPIWV